MKFCKASLFVALLVVACLPVAAQAQIQLNIPFNFFAAGKSLPAGHYEVTCAPGRKRGRMAHLLTTMVSRWRSLRTLSNR